ncbi:MAG: rRNA maturation RNase YbeY [Spirochaetales bacterium]|nr:rRNA maturation RNase YbeY [Spirochaetales bacterium]
MVEDKDPGSGNNHIELTSEDPEYLVKYPWIENFLHQILKHQGITSWELSLLLCPNDTIEKLNSQYRSKNRPTDILSFSQIEGSAVPFSPLELLYAGDIVISIPYMEKNAMENNVSEEAELKTLLIHGVLHLLGMDHTEDDTQMLDLQKQIYTDLTKGDQIELY